VTPSRPVISADSATARANAARIVDFFEQVLATGDAEAARGFLGDAFVDHDPAPGAPTDAAGVVTKLKALWIAFPQGRFALQEVAAAGDRVAARSIFSGTNLGPFGDVPPTGRSVSVSFADFYRLAGGRITEHWHDFDKHGLMQQLGVLPR
jgi:steroid delta-isomerase-like uncharacterized protein